MKTAYLLKGARLIEITYESMGPKMLVGCKYVATLHGWGSYVPSRIHFEEVEFTFEAARARAIKSLQDSNENMAKKIRENEAEIFRLSHLSR